MKKILLSCIGCLMLSSIVFASDSRGTIDVGLGNTSIETDNGLSASFNISGEKRFLINDLYLGIGMSTNAFDSELKSENEIGGVMIDLYGKISYDIIKSLTISGLYGYTIGEIGSQYFDGTTFGGEVKYSINKSYAVGLNYKYSELTTTYDFDFATERVGAFIAFKL